jgi:hypothetical protein
MDTTELRNQAYKARRLAEQGFDQETRARLLAYAKECEDKARRLDLGKGERGTGT